MTEDDVVITIFYSGDGYCGVYIVLDEEMREFCLSISDYVKGFCVFNSHR